MEVRKVGFAAGGWFLVLMAMSTAPAVVLDFDDLAGKAVPDDYGGLNWVDPVTLENQWTVDPNHLPQNDTPCALLYTGDTVAEATISSAEPIDFLGIEFAGNFGDRVQIVAHGPRGEYSTDSVELAGDSVYQYERQWLEITSLSICFDSLFPGSTCMDNLTFEPSPRLATIYSEDFESFVTNQDLMDAGWQVQHGQFPAEGGGIWQLEHRVLDGQGVAGSYAISNSDAEGELPPLQYLDESLISPEIDCAGFTEVRLEFCQHIDVYQEENPDEVFNVHVSSDPAHQDWKSNVVPLWREEDGDWTYPRRIDVSEFADGKKIKVRWRYRANNDYWWAIDGVKVLGRPMVLEVTDLQVDVASQEVSISWDAPDGVFTVESSPQPDFSIVTELATGISGKQWTGTDPGVLGGRRIYRVRMD
jgi:hypothetical protein